MSARWTPSAPGTNRNIRSSRPGRWTSTTPTPRRALTFTAYAPLFGIATWRACPLPPTPPPSHAARVPGATRPPPDRPCRCSRMAVSLPKCWCRRLAGRQKSVARALTATVQGGGTCNRYLLTCDTLTCACIGGLEYFFVTMVFTALFLLGGDDCTASGDMHFKEAFFLRSAPPPRAAHGGGGLGPLGARHVASRAAWEKRAGPVRGERGATPCRGAPAASAELQQPGTHDGVAHRSASTTRCERTARWRLRPKPRPPWGGSLPPLASCSF